MSTSRSAWIEAERQAVREDIGRADAKATALLGIVGTMLSITAAGTAFLAGSPAAARVAGVGAVLLAVAVGVLGWVIVPRLGGRAWVGAADATVAELLAVPTDEDDQRSAAADLQWLARLARRKFRLVTVAVWLLIGAAVVLAGAAGIAAAG